MELALSVGGDSSIPTLKPFSFLEITAANTTASSSAYEDQKKGRGKDIGFCMGALGNGGSEEAESGSRENTVDEEQPLQLRLTPLSPPPVAGGGQLRFPWLSQNLGTEPGFLSDFLAGKAVDKNQRVSGGAEEAAEESPNSGASSFPTYRNVRWWSRKRDLEGDTTTERGASSNNTSVGSDEEEINGGGVGRKKLRLTRQQSAFLEETFKQHSTLNPKNKAALAKQLNLRPRQVEVWFQNRRARTKLKQTEVDCEYLRRCCDTLREENKRLQKELQELRALKTSHPFYNHLPATTLNMCPSCVRLASAAATTPSAAATNTALSLPKSES